MSHPDDTGEVALINAEVAAFEAHVEAMLERERADRIAEACQVLFAMMLDTEPNHPTWVAARQRAALVMTTGGAT